jgi:putative ABC transport system permease protein
MLKSYFKIAFRSLWRHRIFSLINILGLSVGMTACFLIFLFVRFELSYDNMHGRADRICRIVSFQVIKAAVSNPVKSLRAE